MTIEEAVLAERERCAAIAAYCARGVAIEVNGETHLLGVMLNDPASAQYATACAIMEAIESGEATAP
jgi:hypothetical protein